MDTFVDGGKPFQRITSLGPLVELYIKGMTYNPLWNYEIDYYGGNYIFSNNYSRMEWESHPWNCIRLIFPHFYGNAKTNTHYSQYLLKFPGCISCVFFKPLASSVVHTTHFRQPDNVLVLITFARFGWSQLKAFASGVLKGYLPSMPVRREWSRVVFCFTNQFKPWDLMTCLPRSSLDKRKVRIGAIARNLSKLPCSTSSIWVEGTPRYTNLSGGWIYFFGGKFHHHLKLLETLVKN